jgi:hypothetical protein
MWRLSHFSWLFLPTRKSPNLSGFVFRSSTHYTIHCRAGGKHHIDESIDCYRTPSRRPSVCRTGAPPRSISIRTRTLTERERRRDFLILYEVIIWEGNEKKPQKTWRAFCLIVGAKVAISSLTSNKQPPSNAGQSPLQWATLSVKCSCFSLQFHPP